MKNQNFLLIFVLALISSFLHSQTTTYDMWGPNSPNEILKVNMLDPGIGSTPKLIMESSGIFVDNGNIGIGFSSPTAKLHVNGTIISNSDISGANIIGSIKTQSIQPFISQSDINVCATGNDNRFLFQSDGKFALGEIDVNYSNQLAKLDIISTQNDEFAISIQNYSPYLGKGLHIFTMSNFPEQDTPFSIFHQNDNVFRISGEGRIDFMGGLFQNSIEIKPSKWLEQGDDIYFDSGDVDISNNLQVGSLTTYGNAAFLSDIGFLQSPGNINNVNEIQGANNLILNGDNNGIDMFISGDGNVGIGTSSPAYSLDVFGTISTNGLILDNGTQGNGKVLVSDANGLASWIDPTSVDDGDWTINGSNIYRLNGNVGIGTSNTSEAMLTVNGKIISSEIEVMTNVPSSDFVFEDDYTLMDLQTLELFVKKNKHLPEIPSASEFAENGYNMNDMDDLLLRKVEELTLYIIELKKEISQLKSE